MGISKASAEALKASASIFTPLSLVETQPIVKIQLFGEAKCDASLVNLQCYSLVMSLIQYFQAYVVTGKNNLIPQLSVDEARKIRNALVHQQVIDQQAGNLSFILDGQAENLKAFATALMKAHKFKDATALQRSSLYHKLISHGTQLAGQQQAGLREHIQYRHRVIYSQFIQGLSQAFDSLLSKDNVSKDMVTHAKAALNILKQLYCLRESGCQWQEMEIRQAKMLRHLKLKLTEPTTVQRTPSPNPLPH